MVVVLWVWKRRRVPMRDKEDKLLDFAAGLVATFCGVALGLAVTNWAAERQERRAVTGLLRAADADVLQACAQISFYVDQDTVFSPKLSDFFVMSTKVPSPQSLDDVMQSETVLRRISPLSFKAIAGMRTTGDEAQSLAASRGTPDDRRKALWLCGASYFSVHHALENEIAWQEGRITALARDSKTRYWWVVEQNEEMRPGSWKEFMARPAVRESLLELGVEHGSVGGRGRSLP
jgi:hypothetical protein